MIQILGDILLEGGDCMNNIIRVIMMLLVFLINTVSGVNESDALSKITVNGKEIIWGSTAEEIYSMLGEPDAVTKNEKDEILIYENVETDFADAVSIEFTVGSDNINDINGNHTSSGLYFVQLNTNGENIEDLEQNLNKVYGYDTYIETDENMQNQVLKITEEGYFYKQCQNDKWKINNLNIDDADGLIDYMNKNINYPKADKETSVLEIELYGVQNDNVKNCTLKFSASKYVLYRIFTEMSQN